MKTIVVYHHPCTDGLTAAACAFLRFKNEATYIKHSMERKRDYLEELLPLILDGGNLVYFLDCAPLVEELELFGTSNTITIIDHHLTNMQAYDGIAELPPNVMVHFDMNKSGAGMSWDYFHADKLRPMMISYVEDRDLWKFKYDSTKAFNLGVMAYPETLESYADILSNNKTVMQAIKHGEIIGKYVDDKVIRACKHNVKMRTLAGYKAIFINATESISDVGNKALEIYPTAQIVAVYQHFPSDNTFKVSLRSDPTIGVDVSAVAKLYRGGGHKTSSGCIMTTDEFMEIFK